MNSAELQPIHKTHSRRDVLFKLFPSVTAAAILAACGGNSETKVTEIPPSPASDAGIDIKPTSVTSPEPTKIPETDTMSEDLPVSNLDIAKKFTQDMIKDDEGLKSIEFVRDVSVENANHEYKAIVNTNGKDYIVRYSEGLDGKLYGVFLSHTQTLPKDGNTIRALLNTQKVMEEASKIYEVQNFNDIPWTPREAYGVSAIERVMDNPDMSYNALTSYAYEKGNNIVYGLLVSYVTTNAPKHNQRTGFFN